MTFLGLLTLMTAIYAPGNLRRTDRHIGWIRIRPRALYRCDYYMNSRGDTRRFRAIICDVPNGRIALLLAARPASPPTHRLATEIWVGDRLCRSTAAVYQHTEQSYYALYVIRWYRPAAPGEAEKAFLKRLRRHYRVNRVYHLPYSRNLTVRQRYMQWLRPLPDTSPHRRLHWVRQGFFLPRRP
jgi:hypothetical protein